MEKSSRRGLRARSYSGLLKMYRYSISDGATRFGWTRFLTNAGEHSAGVQAVRPPRVSCLDGSVIKAPKICRRPHLGASPPASILSVPVEKAEPEER